MNNLWEGLIVLAVLVLTGFLVMLIIELKKTTRSLRNTIDNNLNTTLGEIQETLKSIRNISDNITGITSDVKNLTGNVKEVGQNVKHVSELVGNVTSATSVTVAGLKAGIKTAIGVILNNLFTRKGGG